jgi:mannose-1-phosphate guanylyltransferase/mannose-6-phosphate isomerase
MQLIPTILCGGAGSRLWPVSRELHPKPFIRLNDGVSFLQKAFIRGALLPNVKEILTVTNRELYFKTQDEYKEVNQLGLHTSYILEPFGKNTAAAIASSALYVANNHGPDAVMLILPADHLINNQEVFQRAVEKAVESALAGKLVAFGIQPTSPETGYGYIEVNSEAELDHILYGFVEKPSKDIAEAYLASGRYLWNSGMFCFTAGSVLEHMKQYCPMILEATKACFDDSVTHHSEQTSQLQLDPASFAKIHDDSFDYAVMEPASLAFLGRSASSSLAVVPCPTTLGWSDIGSWSALGDLSTPDAQGNRVDGPAALHDTTGCYVQSRDRLIGLVGVENLIVVDTPDALLVVDKSRAQDVKHLYATLKADGHDTHKLHRTVHRPWGTYTVLEEGFRFKIKRIEVKPGACLSLQMHHHRSEHWIVVSGMASVTNGNIQQLITTNQSTYIPAGNKHRLENPGLVTLVMIEVQSGEYLGEDDIIRFEDNYGRIQETV